MNNIVHHIHDVLFTRQPGKWLTLHWQVPSHMTTLKGKEIVHMVQTWVRKEERMSLVNRELVSAAFRQAVVRMKSVM